MITAALSIQDPRERPVEQRARADQLHARFRDPRSDFMAWLNLWRHLRDEAEGDGLQRLPADVPRGAPQLPARAGVAGLRVPAAPGGQAGGAQAGGSRRRAAPDADGIHQALLSGLLSHIGLRDRGPARLPRRPRARGSRSSPGSGLFKSQPDLVMSAELVETSRLWGRQNAAIDPAWAERLGRRPGQAHLLRAALVEEARVGAGPRARHPVRRTAGRRPRRPARPAPARRGPRAVHPACAGAGGVAHPAPLLRDQPPAARGGRGARAPRPSPRHRGRRGDAVRLLRRPGAGRRGLRRALRHLVEAGAPHAARPARPSTPSMLVHEGAGDGRADDFPDEWREGADCPAAALPLRARPPRPTASRSTCRSPP